MTDQSRRNIILMCVIIVMFIVGIILRWDFISRELKTTWKDYTDPFGERPAVEQKK